MKPEMQEEDSVQKNGINERDSVDRSSTDNASTEIILDSEVAGKRNALFMLTTIGIASIAIRLLMNYNFHTSALLYVAVPYLISIALLKYTKRDDSETSWTSGYWNYFRSGLIIMLGSSIILFEGFICVVMFMPIYFGVMLISFLMEVTYRYFKKRGSRNFSHAFPLVVLLVSLEGTSDQLSFNREHSVTVTQVTTQSVADIKANLIKPIELNNKTRPWFLKLFPQPYEVNAESLNTGDVHEIHYRYHRWFVTNTHEGKMRIKIAEVSDEAVKTQVLEDSSYMSNYMTLHGTDITFKTLDNGDTKVSLTVSFTRKLDPYWYFEPLEKYGVGKTAEYVMQHVVLRESQSS